MPSPLQKLLMTFTSVLSTNIPFKELVPILLEFVVKNTLAGYLIINIWYKMFIYFPALKYID